MKAIRSLVLATALVLAFQAPGLAAEAYQCRALLMDKVFDRVVAAGDLAETVDFIPSTKRVRLEYAVALADPGARIPRRPTSGRYFFGFFGVEAQERVTERVADMSELGMILRGSEYRKGRLTLEFVRDPRLVASYERAREPEWVAAQRTKLAELFPKARFHDRYRASKTEVYYNDFPEVHLLLTARTLQGLAPGIYAFVRLRGESFLRLGTGHHLVGAAESAQAAGDIVIRRNLQTRKNEVEYLSPRSDTYRPADDSLVHAVDALWRQGIFPDPLELREWNARTVIATLPR